MDDIDTNFFLQMPQHIIPNHVPTYALPSEKMPLNKISNDTSGVVSTSSILITNSADQRACSHTDYIVAWCQTFGGMCKHTAKIDNIDGLV